MKNNLSKLINKNAIIINLKATTKKAALKEIADSLHKLDYVSSASQFQQAMEKREKEFSTGMGDEVAIPHAQSKVVKNNVVLIAKSQKGINWDSVDKKPVKLIFAIALNEKDKAQQVPILQDLSKMILSKDVIQKIKSAKTKLSIEKNITSFNTEKKVQSSKHNSKNVVAITACPTGIAHTYMAAEQLEKGAKELGYNIKVEKQGRAIEDKLSKEDIEKADIIILAVDKNIEGESRFANKKVYKIGTTEAIKDPVLAIKNAKTKSVMSKISSKSSDEVVGTADWSAFKNVYKNLMGGVSKMLPFIVAGGILLGIGFLLDSGITGGHLGVTRDVARWFSGLGKLGLNIFVPILGAYVAYSIVGNEGLMPGFFAGLIASNGAGGMLYGGDPNGWSNLWGGLTPGIPQDILASGSGFIGAMIGGYFAAATVVIARKYIFAKTSKNFRGVVSIIGVPVSTALMIGAIMFVVNIPMVYMAYGLRLGLNNLNSHNLIWLLGIVIGLMMAFDMGGPVNKVAYTLGTSLIAQQGAGPAEFQIMGIVMIGGMVPPLAIAFSNLVFRKKAWSQTDINESYSNWLLGAFFITEGAIPYASKDPKRVIPSIMLGSAVAGLIMGLFKIGMSAPHGGIFVFALLKSYTFDSAGLQIGFGVLFTLGAIAAGTAVGGITMGLWRMHDIKKNKLQLI